MNNLIMSSRVRLARNLKTYPFPTALTLNSSQKMIDDVNLILKQIDLLKEPQVKMISEMSVSEIDKLLLDKTISIDLLRQDILRGFVKINKEVVMLVNEEDHFRIQGLSKTKSLLELYKEVRVIDKEVLNHFPIAYHDEYGFLSSCISNLGTGLRASIMMHLPALTHTRDVNNVYQAVTKLGMTFRGVSGEYSDSVSNTYQISNQITLGKTEKEIIEEVELVSKQLTKAELEARQHLLKDEMTLIDKVSRAKGLLFYARKLSEDEALRALSEVRFGIELVIIKDITLTQVDDAIAEIILDKYRLAKMLDDESRADVVRKLLKERSDV